MLVVLTVPVLGQVWVPLLGQVRIQTRTHHYLDHGVVDHEGGYALWRKQPTR